MPNRLPVWIAESIRKVLLSRIRFAIAGVIYYLLTLVISRIFRLLEAHYNRYILEAR